jgi:hypothetical protein
MVAKICINDDVYSRAMLFGTNFNVKASDSKKLNTIQLFSKLIKKGIKSLQKKEQIQEPNVYCKIIDYMQELEKNDELNHDIYHKICNAIQRIIERI